MVVKFKKGQDVIDGGAGAVLAVGLLEQAFVAGNQRKIAVPFQQDNGPARVGHRKALFVPQLGYQLFIGLKRLAVHRLRLLSLYLYNKKRELG